MKQYYYVTPSNEQAGPVYPQDFSALGIDADTLVFSQGLSGWTPAGQLPELVPYLQRPMAQPYHQQFNQQMPRQQYPQQQFPQQQFPQQQYPQQQYPQQYPQANVYAPAQQPYERKKSNVPGILGFIFSLVTATFSWIPVVNIFAMILWIPALILSIIGVCKRPKALALVGLIITLLVLGFWIFVFSTYSYYYNSINF